MSDFQGESRHFEFLCRNEKEEPPFFPSPCRHSLRYADDFRADISANYSGIRRDTDTTESYRNELKPAFIQTLIESSIIFIYWLIISLLSMQVNKLIELIRDKWGIYMNI